MFYGDMQRRFKLYAINNKGTKYSNIFRYGILCHTEKIILAGLLTNQNEMFLCTKE